MSVIFEHNNIDIIRIVYNVLTDKGGFKRGDTPKYFDNSRIISYVLVENSDKYLDCEIKIKKDDNEVITQREYDEKFETVFCADDIPF